MIEILQEIQAKKQKLFGTHLKSSVLDLETWIFRQKEKLTEDQLRLIIYGNESFDGLLSLCDNRENFTNNLKKSSVEAFRVIYRLMTDFSKLF